MLFCSSVEVAGSVMPAGGVSENAACDDWKRLLMRSIMTTAPAANNPEIRAINKIWRAKSLYIKPSSLSKILDLADCQTSVCRMLAERAPLRADCINAGRLRRVSQES